MDTDQLRKVHQSGKGRWRAAELKARMLAAENKRLRCELELVQRECEQLRTVRERQLAA